MQDANPIPNSLTHAQLFQQLAGSWRLKRIIQSASTTLPAGTFIGKADFVAQTPTTPGYSKEYRYQESGHFTTTDNISFYSQQIYIYRLHTQPDAMSVWPTDEHHQARREKLHVLDRIIAQPNTNRRYHLYCIQGSPHHCKRDQYQIDYQFYFTDTHLGYWLSTYVVQGPKKDYRIRNHYTRTHVSVI